MCGYELPLLNERGLTTIVFSSALRQVVWCGPDLLGLRLKGGREHVREEFQCHRQQELHERNDDEHQEGEEPEHICTRPQELEMTSKYEKIPQHYQTKKHNAMIFSFEFLNESYLTEDEILN